MSQLKRGKRLSTAECVCQAAQREHATLRDTPDAPAKLGDDAHKKGRHGAVVTTTETSVEFLSESPATLSNQAIAFVTRSNNRVPLVQGVETECRRQPTLAEDCVRGVRGLHTRSLWKRMNFHLKSRLSYSNFMGMLRSLMARELCTCLRHNLAQLDHDSGILVTNQYQCAKRLLSSTHSLTETAMVQLELRKT
eukprot:CAMPEP_0194537754 /NCGR_PEP_ID=MMETSP0253-20130528/77107_1 /TAXON_ID=2966 /ORGANISM="Noctiluca scintillans" /LENGTH=193 /DNA_ID=CAMNT_0039383801 /DNA_START=130 /DNA_END=712 /DNA_ORIENTATION=-